MSRAGVLAVLAAGGLAAVAASPARAQAVHLRPPSAGGYQFICSALGGTGCAQPIPDNTAMPTQPVVNSSFVIATDAPQCRGRTVKVIVTVLHGAPHDLAVTLRHVEPNLTITLPSSTDAGANNDGEDYQHIYADASVQGDISGTWQLSIEDQHDGDYGQLADWRIVVDCPSPKTISGETGGSRPGVAEPGELLDYTMTLRNDDLVPMSATLTDAIPVGTTFVSADNGGGVSGANVQWTDVPVPAQSTLDVHLRVQVVDPLPAGLILIENQANIYLADPVIAVGTSSLTCDPAVPASCAKTAIPTGAVLSHAPKTVVSESGNVAGAAEPGETIGYAITLVNIGPTPIIGVNALDPLPAGATFVSADNGGSFGAGQVSWSGLTVPANGSLVLHVSVRVLDPVPVGQTELSNQATVDGVTTCADVSNPLVCNPTVLPIAPPAPGVLGPTLKQIVSESGSVAGFAEAGEQMGYALTLHNTGASAVTGVTVDDPLPVGTSFVSADSGGALVAGHVQWSSLSVPAAGTLVLHVVVQVADPLPPGQTQVSNQALVNGVATCADISGSSCSATVLPFVGVAPSGAVAAPVLGPLLAMLLALMLAGLALPRLRRR